MKYYESMVIFTPNLSDQDAVAENTKIHELVKKLQGEIVKTVNWGKRNMAYEINKKREGHYMINYFNIPANALPQLERHYRLTEQIVRYNLLLVEEGRK